MSAEDESGTLNEESTAHFEPIVHLEPVKLITGEEDEDLVYEQRGRLYRLSPADKEWKERGLGMAKILKHKVTGVTRIIMREEKTLKLRLNHLLSSEMKLQPNMGSDRVWTWAATDFSEEKAEMHAFALKLKTPELAAEFKAAFEKAAKEGDAAKAALAAKGGSSTPPAEPAAAAPEASPAPAAAQPSGDAK